MLVEAKTARDAEIAEVAQRFEVTGRMNFSRNQIIGAIILLALLWALILFRVLSSAT
jgi:hypothetical protein